MPREQWVIGNHILELRELPEGLARSLNRRQKREYVALRPELREMLRKLIAEIIARIIGELIPSPMAEGKPVEKPAGGAHELHTEEKGGTNGIPKKR